MKTIFIRNQEIKFVYEDHYSHYEDEVIDYIDSIKMGEVFYDIGACLGYFSLYADKKGCDVYSFEIDKKNFIGLNRNTKSNNFSGKIFNIGVSDSVKKTYLLSGQSYIGGHHKTLISDNFVGMPTIKNESYKKIKVNVTDLDSFIINNELPFPDHLKVDIDGSEYDFLKGSQLSLKNTKSMIIELYKYSSKFDEIISELHKMGFVLYKEFKLSQPECDGLINIWYIKK